MSRPWSLVLRGAVLTMAVSVCACGGGHDTTPQTPPQSVPVTIATGRERLEWSQTGDAGSGVANYVFVAYVDGVRSSLPDAGCRAAGTLAFDCSSSLPAMSPGRRSIELAAVDARTGAESAHSPAVAADVLVATGGALGDSAPAPSASTMVPGIAPDARQRAASGVVRGFQDVQSVAAAGARTFIAEGARVWVLDDAQATVAYEASPEGDGTRARIAGIQLDPRFDATRFAYLALIATNRPGEDVLQIRRTREVGGVLGEDASIVSGLAIPGGTSPPWSVGSDGLVYVAIPGPREPVASPPPGTGAIVRFASTGESMGRAASSPALVAGLAQPLALQISGGRGVLVGLTPQGLGGIAFDAGAVDPMPEPFGAGALPGVTAIALWSGGPSSAPRRIFAAAEGGRLLGCGMLEPSGSGAQVTFTGHVQMPEGTRILALSGAGDSEAVVALADDRGTNRPITVRRQQCEPSPATRRLR